VIDEEEIEHELVALSSRNLVTMDKPAANTKSNAVVRQDFELGLVGEGTNNEVSELTHPYFKPAIKHEKIENSYSLGADANVVRHSKVKKKEVLRTKYHDEFREIRLQLNLSRKEFAAILEVNPYLIDSYEYARTQDINLDILDKARMYRDNVIGKDKELVEMLLSKKMSTITKEWADRLEIPYANLTQLARALNKTATTIRRWLADDARPNLSYLVETHKAVFADPVKLACELFLRAHAEFQGSSKLTSGRVVVHKSVFDRLENSCRQIIKPDSNIRSAIKISEINRKALNSILENMDSCRKGMIEIDDADKRRFYVGDEGVLTTINVAKILVSEING